MIEDMADMIVGQRPKRYPQTEELFLKQVARGSKIVGIKFQDHGRVMLSIEYSRPYYDDGDERMVDTFAVQIGETDVGRRQRLKREKEQSC